MGAAGGVKAADPACEVIGLHRIRRRRLQPLRDPLRARQGDRQLRAAVPGLQAGLRRCRDRRPLQRRRDRASMSRRKVVGSPARARSPGTGWCSRRVSTTPTRACPAAISAGSTTSRTSARPSSGTRSWTPSRRRWSSRPRRSGVEMVTALAHRGIETHLVDPGPGRCREMADPDIMAPVEESWRELGVTTHFNTTLKAFLGDDQVRAVADLRRRDRGRPRRGLHAQGAEQRPGRRRRV